MTLSAADADLVRRYNDAWLAQDIAAMSDFLADDLVLWHNHIGRKFGKTEMLGFITGALDVIDRVEFRNVRRIATTGGVVQQHDLHVEMKDGAVLDAPNCIIYTITDGKISRIEEYVDGVALQTVKIKERAI